MVLAKLENYINGTFQAPSSQNYIESYNPAIGKAFLGWSTTKRSLRSEIMLKIAHLIEEKLEDFAVAESRDQGKPIKLAREVDIPRAVYNFKFFATYILHLESKATEIDGIATNYVQRTPVGVAALISPWNLPLYLLTWKIAPAIAYGCTCVCKPSEFTSHTAYLLCKVMSQAGLPAGVVNMVFGNGVNAGEALVNHPNVDVVSFTGGTLTGSRIASNCAPKFKKVSLELGGKNANIIFADCNFEEAVNTTVRSSFSNQGEICLCGSRIFVEESIYEKFIESFIEKTKKLKVGDPSDASTNLGAIVSKEHLEKIQFYVDLAKQEGGKIVHGGERITVSCKSFINGKETDETTNGWYFSPTIITGLSPSHRVCQEEIFGPVVTVVPFKTEEEVLEYANGTEYGLSSSVWSENGRKAKRIAEKLQVGTVWINCWMIRDLNMPFGGVKASGLGREGSAYSLEFFSEEKTICMAN
ncbi:Aldehyde dehydrogenase 8 member A1 [Clydaea vesicula]|uniref:Aldehyde dehydrogenase 8 member A1 n=1 Tax=Clydaea vesicula TaxID=447962 RepID=A0AAD5U9Q8_9FUNG|nr:Aldehyde dehydrogenase 8 member A1 [Clydaea vesicula]